jgi:hypothetical protein
MKLTSRAFKEGEKIPSKYTCDGENINPPLDITDIPQGTVSLVFIMDDPDVPKFVRADGMYDHWIIFNLPPDLKTIPENATLSGTLGKNTSGQDAYTGPCPPDREHRYFFKLYALKTSLSLPQGATKANVEKAMKDHIIDKTMLMGRYERTKR